MLHVLTSTKKKAVFRGEEIHRENGFLEKLSSVSLRWHHPDQVPGFDLSPA